jgi:hypothetical protein
LTKGVTINSLMALLLRAKEILQTEGLLPLLRRGFIFLAGYLFRYEHYYLYEHTIKERNEAGFLPKMQGFTLKIVATKQQADELAAAGFDFGSRLLNERRGLDRGAVAFCFFIDGKLAHIGWVAMSQAAKDSFDSSPYRVDFAAEQACTGGTWTNPKYRGRGLMVYAYFKRLQFLWENGFKSSRNAVNVANAISLKAQIRLGPRMYVKARYLRILWWDSWRETPVS